MARLRLILFISWVCAGCAATAPQPVTDPGPPERPLRLLAREPLLMDAIGHALVAAPPLDVRSVTTAMSELEQQSCRRFRPAGAGDRRLAPEEIVHDWEAGLRRKDAPHGWLLQPVSGAIEVSLGAVGHAAGFRIESDALVICSTGSTPDWAQRLGHPALWPGASDPSTRGAGVFRRDDDGRYRRRGTGNRERVRRVDRIDPVSAAGESAATLLSSGRVDLAVVYGREAGEAASDGTLRRKRLEAWDTVYALWVDTRGRWVNDPEFRRWIATRVDRESMTRYLFGEQATPSTSLIGADPPPVSTAVDRPFSATSAPRLSLSFDGADPHAASIAARVKAVLERESPNLHLELVDEPAPSVGSQMRLLAHHPPVDDALLSLLDSLWFLRGVATDEIRRLLRATQIDDAGRRRESAAQLEARLIKDGRLVPLVRLHAWLIGRRDLTGVDAAAYGVLRLENAEWAR
jgi:hypothetical protein